MHSSNWQVMGRITVLVLPLSWINPTQGAQPCPTVCPDGSRPYFCVCPVMEDELQYSRPRPKITTPKRSQAGAGGCNASRRPSGGRVACPPLDVVTPPSATTLLPFEPETVAIPAGSFEMGSPDNEPGRTSDEGPVHTVNIKAFRMGKYEVTRGQFRAFVETTGYKTVAEQGDGCYGWTGFSVTNSPTWEKKAEFNWLNLGFAQDDNHPVGCVTWNDAVAYTKWLTEQTGKTYRLPTEAEWEYAARAGTYTARFWGDDPNQACKYANVPDQTKNPSGGFWASKHECNDGYLFTAPVGSFTANSFGLYDMTGNLWEWNQDRWHADYKGAPTNGGAWETGDSKNRLLRGCTYGDEPDVCRSAIRFSNSLPYFSFSFRVAVGVAGRAL